MATDCGKPDMQSTWEQTVVSLLCLPQALSEQEEGGEAVGQICFV